MTWEALTEAAKLGCGVIMIGRGKFTLVDEDMLEELENATWSPHSGGYSTTNTGPASHRKILYLHRFISNPPPGMEVDHANQNKLDNRRCNLRNCDHTHNTANNGRRSHNRTSKFKGVRKWRNTYSARCILNGKETTFSGFKTEVEAAIAYNEWAKKTFGEFARLNVIP